MSEKIQAFLRENGFAPARADRMAVMRAFENEADAAIAGAPSSLRMIDSCLSFSSVVPATSAPVVVVDAGGTNLRVAAVRFTADGPVFSHLRRSRMPGTDGTVSADAFHAAIAAEVDAVRALEPEVAGIGYCFSYECRSLPDGDAELVGWSKQVSAPEVVGQRVGAELVRRLAGGPLPVVVLNDTVATLLAGLSCRGAECPGQIGFILGTGTNVACVEKGTIRNAESGECDKMARSPCDIAFDATLPDTGAAPFEKMVSGAYLGGVGHELLKAAARAGLIDGAKLDGITLSTLDLDAFGAGDVSSTHPLAAALAPGDVPVAREIVRAVFLRAVSLTAAHLAAFVRRSAVAGRSPVRITADGSTYWKTRTVDFDGLVRKEIAELVPDVPFEIVRIDEAPMVGAAVAAMRFERSTAMKTETLTTSKGKRAGIAVAVMVLSCAFVALSADKVVGWREKQGVHVESGTVTETDNVFQSDNSEFYKTGAGTYVLPGAKFNQRRPPNFVVADGTLKFQAGEDATVDVATPPVVLQDAAFWVDAGRNVVTEESDGATRVTRWCDARETDTATPTMGYAVPAWNAGKDEGFATMLSVKPAYVTKDGVQSVYFGGAKSGQYMNFVTSAGADRTLSHVKHAFVVHGVYECFGAVIGGRASGHGIWIKWDRAGLVTEAQLRSSKSHSVNYRSDMAPQMMSSRWYLDGRAFDILREPPDIGKFQLLAMDSLTTEMPVSCFYNEMGLNIENGKATTRGGDYLAEAVFFERKLSEAERISVERYLMKKWNLGADKLALGQLPVNPAAPDGATTTTNGLWTTRFTGNVAIAKDATFAVETPAGTRSPLVSLSGEGTVVKTGSGSLQIGPQKGSPFTGAIDLQEGVIDVRGGAYPALKAVAGRKVTGTASGNQSIFRAPTNQFESSARYAVQAGNAGEFAKAGLEPLAVSTVDAAVKKLSVLKGQLQLTCPRNVAAVDNSKAFAATNLQVRIADPGFEHVTVTNGDYYTHSASAGDLDGWTPTGTGVNYLLAVSDGQVLPNYTTSQWDFWINRRPVEGNNCIKLATQWGSPTLSQQLSFPMTGRYRLSFYMTGMVNGGWSFKQQPLCIQLDGVTVGYAFTGVYDWLRTYVNLGEVSAGPHTLTFSYNPKRTLSLIALDDVRIDFDGGKQALTADYPIPNGDFEEWVTEYAGVLATNYPYAGDYNHAKGWTCTATNTPAHPGVFPAFVATDGTRMTSKSGDNYAFSATRLLSVRSSDKTGCSYLAFAGSAGRASTTFEAPQGIWYLKAKVAHDKGYFAGPNYGSDFKLQAKITRADSSVVDLGTVIARGCVFDEVVWPTGLTFTAPENVTLTLIPLNASIGVVDDLRLGFAGVNLVQNGSFEYDTDWSSCADKSVYVNSGASRLDTCSSSQWQGANKGFCGHDGKYVGQIMTTATFYQDIYFPESGYYRLSFAIRSRVGVNNYGKNVLTFWEGGDDMGAITTNKIVQVQPDTLNFVEHSYLFYVPTKGVRRFGISGEGCPGVGIGSWTENTSAIDSVSIVRALDVDANAVPSAPKKMRISVDTGATLNLDFTGTLTCGPVTLGGTTVYGLVNAQTYPQYVTGVGSLQANNPGAMIIFR